MSDIYVSYNNSATAKIIQFQPGIFGIREVKHPESGFEEAYREILKLALQKIRDLGGKEAQLRLILDPSSSLKSEILNNLGFRRLSQRQEYRQDLSRLPDDNDSPLKWAQVSDVSKSTLRKIATSLETFAKDDPDWAPHDDAYELLRGYLGDEELSTGPHCIHLGYIGTELIAIVIAQVEAKSGWSRITYMGLKAEYRGRGLGRWVHRHGFRMMKDQGGKTYHGGTNSLNLQMNRLFQKNGCEAYRSLEEWAASFP